MAQIMTPTAGKISQEFVLSLQAENLQQLISHTLKNENRIVKFNASMLSAVTNNPKLLKCDVGTLVAANLSAMSMGLSVGPLNYAYFVPYFINGKWKAQLQISYRGYVQLALRSGEYENIDAMVIREGEYFGRDEFSGRPKFKFINDEELAASKPIIGYMATLKLNRGFQKTIYWTKNAIIKHAQRYSESFRQSTGNDNWTKDFDVMALKTVLRQLLGKWGIMSEEMQEAYEKDMAVIDENQNIEYVDNLANLPDLEEIEDDKVETKSIKGSKPPIPPSSKETGEVIESKLGSKAPSLSKPIPPSKPTSEKVVDEVKAVEEKVVKDEKVGMELPPFMQTVEAKGEEKKVSKTPPSIPVPSKKQEIASEAPKLGVPPTAPKIPVPPKSTAEAPKIPVPQKTIPVAPKIPMPSKPTVESTVPKVTSPPPVIQKPPVVSKPPLVSGTPITPEQKAQIEKTHAEIAERLKKKGTN